MARDCDPRRRRDKFPNGSTVAPSRQRIGCFDSVPHCCDLIVRVKELPRNQRHNSERLADCHSDLPRCRHHVRLSVCYVWNPARRIWISRRHWRRTNWDLRAHRGLDGRPKPTSCCEVGGSVEPFWHARSDCCSRNRTNFSGARPRYLPTCAGTVVPRTTTWNSYPHFIP